MLKIAVAGAYYVGMANALVLVQHHEVTVLDISAEQVEMVRRGRSPVRDEGMETWLSEEHVELSTFTEAEKAICDAELVLIATPTRATAFTSPD